MNYRGKNATGDAVGDTATATATAGGASGGGGGGVSHTCLVCIDRLKSRQFGSCMYMLP